MNRFKFNFDLIACLSSVLDLTVTEIARRCDINQPTLRLYVERKRIIPMKTLFGLCNTFRIPSRYFFYEDEPSVIPTRERATIEARQWRPIEWNYEAVEKAFGDAPHHIYWKDVARAMGVTEQKPRGRFALKTRFPVTDFLRVCNAFNLSPYTFITDHNFMPSESSAAPLIRHPEGDGSRLNLAALQARIDDLTEKYSDLLAKYDDLLQAHTALLHRISVNIDTINGSYLSIAAEPMAPPYGIKKEEYK